MLYANGPSLTGGEGQRTSNGASADVSIYMSLVEQNGAAVVSAANATTQVSGMTHALHHERLVPSDIFPFRSALRHSLLDRHSGFFMCASMTTTLFSTLASFVSASNAAAATFGRPSDLPTSDSESDAVIVTLVGLSSIFGGILLGVGMSTLVGRVCLGGRFDRAPARSMETDAIETHIRNAATLEENVARWAGEAPTQAWRDAIAQAQLWRNEEHAQTFSAFLDQLHAGAQRSLRGAYDARWQGLRERILVLLSNLASHPVLRQRLFQHAEDALGNCHDRPPITLIDMELIASVQAASLRITSAGQDLAASDDSVPDNLREIVHGCRQLWRKEEFVKYLTESLLHLRDASHDPLEAVISCMEMAQTADRTFLPALAYPPLYLSLMDTDVLRRHAVAAMTSVLEKEQASDGQGVIDFVLQSDLSKDALATLFPREVAACGQTRKDIEEKAADTDDPVLLIDLSRQRMKVDRDILGGYVRDLLSPAVASESS